MQGGRDYIMVEGRHFLLVDCTAFNRLINH